MDRSASQSIHKIVLLEIRPPALGVENRGGAASAFGLLGAAVQAGVDDGNSKKFAAAVNQRRPGFARVLIDGLSAQLRAKGFQVTYDARQRPRLVDGKDDYSAVTTEADAILNVWFASFGYVSTSGSTYYTPRVVVRARLVDAKTRKELYFRSFAASTGFDVVPAGMTSVAPAPGARFQSFDALMEAVDPAVAALLQVERDIANNIAADIRGQ